MIDESKRRRARAYEPQEGQIVDLALLSPVELVQLRSDIDKLLPDTSSMDLHRELAVQYALVKAYQAEVQDNDDVPPNQVAQVMNTTVATLAQLIKLQESLERAETFKKMEGCLIEAVSLLPDEAKAKFFEEYEALAASKDLH